MTRASTPTVRRRELASRLRELRLDAGLTIEQVAASLLISTTKISRLETANRPANLRDVRDLAELYGVPAAERDRLMDLARDSRRSSWWQRYGLPETLGTFAELEAEALSMIVYETSFVPSLLQTEDYARAVTRGTTFGVSAEQIDQRVRSRLDRQERLNGESPPELHAVVDEGALHRLVGGPGIMRAQLETLADRSRLQHIHLQVIPWEAGAHPGMNSTFIILELPDAAASDVVYIEGLHGRFFLQSSGDLSRYRKAYEEVRALSLGIEASRDRIMAIAESLPNHSAPL